MISKDLENIIKALPSFQEMIVSSGNPLTDGVGNEKSLDAATKAIWFLIPFHFLAFLGLVPLKNSVTESTGDTAIVLGLGFASLLGLSWIGTVFSGIPARVLNWSIERRYWSSASWVAALYITWFYCVASMSLINLYIWYDNWYPNKFGTWPSLFYKLEHVLDSTFLRNYHLEVLTIGIPVLSSILMVASLQRGRRGTWLQKVVLVAICAIACGLLVRLSITSLEPVTRVAAS